MDSEGDPFESSEEKEYNRAILELAKKRLECDSQLEELQQEVAKLAVKQSAGGPGPTSSGDGDFPGASGNSSFFEKISANENHTTAVSGDPVGGTGVQECPPVQDCPPIRECPTVRECPPCPRFSCSECPPISTPPDECGPSTTSGGDLDTMDSTSTVLATPEAVLVGAAATLLVLLLAAVVGLLLRYVPILFSGLLILALVALVWYFSSKYPGAARRLGARIWEALRSGVTTVVDRLLGRRHHPEVSVSCII